jgi:hypothetical protein
MNYHAFLLDISNSTLEETCTTILSSDTFALERFHATMPIYKGVSITFVMVLPCVQQLLVVQ